MLNQKELVKLAKGDTVNHFLLLRKCELKTSKNNKNYLNIELGDQSLSLPANLWENFDEFNSSFKIGCVVKVNGLIEEYKEQPQIRISEIRCSVSEDNISPQDFIPKSKRDLSVMKRELRNRIEIINNPFLKELLNKTLTGVAFEKFINAPAGKSWHHSYLHGLLEHTLEIVKICDLVSDFHSEVNRDLLIAGAILHDFGKTEELTFETVFDYSDKGRLLGHIVLAAIKINEKIELIKDFPEELKTQLLHLILSHQGKLEHASPVTPKTIESIILYQADELSAKTNAYKSAIQTEANGSIKWTKFLPLISSNLYITDDFNKKIQSDGLDSKTLFD